jgi:hypothetical protein
MNTLPSDLRALLPDGGITAAENWWSTLAPADRQRIADLWDDRYEVQFFTPQCDDSGAVDEWEKVPAVTGGRFVPKDNESVRPEWGPGYFEHLLQHPELVLAYEPEARTFHIGCTLHFAARTCLESGRVPIGFQCPVRSLTCPLIPLRGADLKPPSRRS